MKQYLSILASFNNGMCCLQVIQNSCESGVFIDFMTVLTWMCACGNGHTMVTCILLNVTIQQ